MDDRVERTADTTQIQSVDRYDFVCAMTLWAMCSAFYVGIAQDYRTLPGYTVYDNLLFGADHVDALRGWVGNHKGIHPLLPLVVVPLSAVFESLTGSYELGLAVMSGCIGGFAVALFFLMLRMLVDRVPSLGLSLLFGLSMNQMVFSGLPDSYVLVAISIMPSFMLLKYGLRTGNVPVVWWIAAGVASASITISTLVQMAVCLIVLLFVQRKSMWKITRFVSVVCGGSLFLLAGLISVQRAVFPTTELFFAPQVYGYETQYLTPLIIDHPGAVADELIKSFWLFNFVGQDPLAVQYQPGLRLELVYFRAAVDYGWLSMAAVISWLMMYVWGARRTLSDRNQRAFVTAAWLCVGTHLALHSFYSTDELFLYAPHYSFIVLLTAVSPSSTRQRSAQLGWLAVALLVGVANHQTHARLIEKYGGPLPSWLLSADAEWRFFPGTEEPPADWMQPAFGDQGWDQSQGGFGYGPGFEGGSPGAGTELEMRGQYSTVYFRTTVDVPDLQSVLDFYADIKYDDGFVLYLNGHQVLSQNAPPRVTYESVANTEHDGIRFERFHVPRQHWVAGQNCIALVALNQRLRSTDFNLAFRLLKTDQSLRR